ncbi:hypothetical protein [Pseudomonas serbica]|uniref:hypothetical protein n=1 Tax=Pseudomonas serbica TaxID=2965074 RepID=UPI00237B5F32|nr:hypothetical protein [Pseudomonas serbica]
MPHHEILKLLEAGDYRIGFHGSAQKITAFTSAGMGRGSDLNTGLGLFTSEIPANAAEYAQNAGELGEGDYEHVYVLAIPCQKPFSDIDRAGFYGRDDGVQLADKASFVALRARLLSEGYDVLDFESSEDVISVCFEPERAIMLAELTAEQAIELQEDGLSLFDGVAIMKTIMEKHPDQLVVPAEKSRVVAMDGPSP